MPSKSKKINENLVLNYIYMIAIERNSRIIIVLNILKSSSLNWLTRWLRLTHRDHLGTMHEMAI